VLGGLSREEVAERAGLCRHSRGLESVARSPAKGSLLFLHYLDVLPPDGSGRFRCSECLLRQFQIVCRKRHQMFGHARLGTLLCEPYAPFG